MKKGFGYYYKKSWSLLNHVNKKHSFFDRFVIAIYAFASFISKGFILTAPIFMIADYNLAKMISETHDYELSKIFDGVASKYKSCLLSTLTYHLIWFGYVLAFVLFFFVSAFDVALDFMSPDFIYWYLLIVLFGGLFILNCFAPVGYISANSSKLDVGDILYSTKRASKKSYAKALLANILYFAPFTIITIGLYILCAFLISVGGFNPFPYTISLQIIYAAVFFFYLMPSMLSKTILLSLVYDDVADPQKSIVVKQVAGEEIEYQPLFTSEDDINILNLSKKEDK